MLYYLYEWWLDAPEPLRSQFSPLRVLGYISVRAFLAAGTAFVASLLLGPWVIRRLHAACFVQPVRKEHMRELADHQQTKVRTPTMGGFLIVGTILASCLLWAVPTNLYVLLTLATVCFLAAVGFWDDVTKVRRGHPRGVRGVWKMGLEALWAAAVFGVLLWRPETRDNVLTLMVPFLKFPVATHLHAVVAFLFLAVVLVGASNAVNLTDGLDGLAIGCSGSAALAYLAMAYAAGHAVFADYLLVPHVPGAGELAVFCGALFGACLGFLWYNCHPAQVFMGDTGSLALGGAIGMVAILIKQELVLAIVGGVFVIEALSVIIQVASFKLTRKRVFAMAPIHHHFQVRKWSETQVVIRFWILGIIFALLGVLTLKIR